MATVTNTPAFKRMDLNEFRDSGLLQEANRLFFHPRGLSLTMTSEKDGSRASFAFVMDFRDDPEGIIFGTPPSAKKAYAVSAMRSAHEERRLANHGWLIQPCAVEEELTP